MFCATVTERTESEGIPVVKRDGEPVVEISTVGNPGPSGRVPLFIPDFIRMGKPELLRRCSVQWARKEGSRIFLLEPDQTDDDTALVLCRFPLPRDGLGVHWSGIDLVRTSCRLQNQYVAPKRLICPRCNVRLTWEDGMHPPSGESFFWPLFPPQGITVLAERETKFYSDSALSDFPERLVVMAPGSGFRVTLLPLDDMARSKGDGGLNFVSAFRRYFLWTGTELKVGSFQQVFPEVSAHPWEHDQL